MVDEVRVLRLLRALSEDLTVLRGAVDDPERRTDPLWLRGVKYTFITAIESCVDVAQHLCAAQGWGPPDDNGDSLALLGRHDVLDPALAGRMRRAVGFRHVLVHEYVKVQDEIVLRQLADLSDLELLGRAVAEWLSHGEARA